MESGKNKIIIIAAPSGAGKTSITRHLLKTFPENLAFSISAATRQPRNYEQNGVDYHFISVEDFEARIARNEFAEWEMVYEGKYYGTLVSELERIWSEGKAPLLDVDVKGGINIKSRFPEQTISIFIKPPSIEELKRRLESRGTESAEAIAARIDKAEYELSFQDQFDVTVLNDDLTTACTEAENLVRKFLAE